jgi:hypothetical protein
MIHWEKWVKEQSLGSLPSYVRKGTWLGDDKVEVSLSRVEEGSKIWHEAVRINSQIVYQSGMNRHDSVYDAKRDICDRAEFWLENR